MAAIIILPFMVTGPAGSNSKNGGRRDKEPWWKFHVASLWAVSNFLFACAMGATLIVDSVFAANVIIGTTGFSWAVTTWAPFALLGEAIHTSTQTSSKSYSADDDAPIPMKDRRTRVSISTSMGGGEEIRRPSADVGSFDVENRSARASRSNLTDEDDSDAEEGIGGDREGLLNGQLGDHDVPTSAGGIGDKAGIILGIHNIFLVIPQFLVTGLSSIIFAIYEPQLSVLDAPHTGLSTPAPPLNGTISDAVLRRAEFEERGFDSIGFLFRLGGVCAAVACVLCYRLSRELRQQRD